MVELLLADKETRGSKYYQVCKNNYIFTGSRRQLILAGTVAWTTRLTHNIGARFLSTNRSNTGV